MKASSELTGKLRADVLAVIGEIVKADDRATANSIMLVLLGRDWRRSDFPDLYGNYGFERAIDRALQYHRRADRIHFEGARGWKLGR